MMDIFEAIEQFKREHPEYDQMKDAIKVAREAMEVVSALSGLAKVTYVLIQCQQ
jgi:hypothetical protein